MRRIANFLLPALPFIFVFIASIYPSEDADLGWHLKYGEYFFQNGHPLYTNIYSTSMVGFHWVNTSWITDLITYSAYALGGFAGISLLGAAVVTLTFFFFSKAYKLRFLEQAIFFPVIAYLEYPINSVSLRGQQLSLLFTGVLLYLLNSFDKKLYRSKFSIAILIPVLFLLWVNIHGQFLFGLGVFGLWVFGKLAAELARTKKINFADLKFWIVIFLASVIAILINPFGFSIYKESFKYIGNPDLKNVVEYLPFPMFSDEWGKLFAAGIVILFGAFSFLMTDRFSKNLPNMLVSFTLLVFSFMVRRFAWPFYYTTFGFVPAFFGFYKRDSFKTKAAGAFILIAASVYIFFVNKPTETLRDYSWDKYCQTFISCSEKSAEFLKTAKIKGPMLTNYNWGGYLIWNYPEIKPSIDGRMHLWRTENGFSGFDEYYGYEQAMKDINSSKYNSAYVWDHKPIYRRLLVLISEGSWKRVYDDGIASVFVRVKPYSSATFSN